ncbi:hypothetical protein NDU88_002683 [Pleurodeles waltl]|uniref:Uncharacterized protein n=1 Tax=Pleurodeles waltl TaxID=8319 RepID=A0AAV7MBQ4_PLEWA|nr:hypothetical protein NDU88_002683 [Pleurodeles waltl]
MKHEEQSSLHRLGTRHRDPLHHGMGFRGNVCVRALSINAVSTDMWYPITVGSASNGKKKQKASNLRKREEKRKPARQEAREGREEGSGSTAATVEEMAFTLHHREHWDSRRLLGEVRYRP